MSRENQAIITVRFFVGQDRERSLVKLFKKLNESIDHVTPGITGWVMKPVEIDDVPVVTLTLQGAGGNSHLLRRTAEEVMQRLAAVPDVSRTYVVGGEERMVRVDLDSDLLQAYNLSPLEVQKAIHAANVIMPGGDFNRADKVHQVDGGLVLQRPEQVSELVVGVFQDRPIFLKDVAHVKDGPAEITSYVRHGWGPHGDSTPTPALPARCIGRIAETEGRVTGDKRNRTHRAATSACRDHRHLQEKGHQCRHRGEHDHCQGCRNCAARSFPMTSIWCITRNYGSDRQRKGE